jgi:hypothetical protein
MKVILKLLAGVLIIMYSLTNTGYVVHADLIWTPEDDFYQKHSEDCEKLNRSYTANGPEGEIVLWKSPVSKKKVASFENGSVFNVEYIYTDKKEHSWGIVETVQGNGWLRMEELVLVYDNISFCEQHESEFQPYNGEFDAYVVEEPILLWTYPGSGKTYGTISELDQLHSFVYVYTDEEGRQWGYYAFKLKLKDNPKSELGNSASWVCLTDPTNKDLPVIEYESADSSVTKQPSEHIQLSDRTKSNQVGNGKNEVILYLGIPVAILLVTTMILIWIFWRKDRKHR